MAKQFNIAAGAVFALAVAAIAWRLLAITGHRASFTLLHDPVFMASLATLAVIANLRRIADWVGTPVPPTIHDPVLGDLTYHLGIWSAQPKSGVVFRIVGRRIGPDPELVRAGAQAAPKLAQLETRARDFAVASGVSAATIGLLSAVELRGLALPESDVAMVLAFSLPNSSEMLNVEFVAGEPVSIEMN